MIRVQITIRSLTSRSLASTVSASVSPVEGEGRRDSWISWLSIAVIIVVIIFYQAFTKSVFFGGVNIFMCVLQERNPLSFVAMYKDPLFSYLGAFIDAIKL